MPASAADPVELVELIDDQLELLEAFASRADDVNEPDAARFASATDGNSSGG
jgi:hypothetical protein